MTFHGNLFFEAIVLAISLIIPIGIQNLYVLRQGILGRHVFASAFTCSFCDSILIVFGGLGLGLAMEAYRDVKKTVIIGGALFLVYYGSRCLIRAIRGTSKVHVTKEHDIGGFVRTLLTAVALSLLNPQVILETVVIIGGAAARHADAAKTYSYIAGAVFGTWCWFFGLAYGARFLRPLFKKPITGRILDLSVAFLLYFIAFSLFRSEVPSFM